MAKDLVRTRHQIEKFYKLKSQLQGVALRIQVCFTFWYMGVHKLGIYRYTLLLHTFATFHSIFAIVCIRSHGQLKKFAFSLSLRNIRKLPCDFKQSSGCWII